MKIDNAPAELSSSSSITSCKLSWLLVILIKIQPPLTGGKSATSSFEEITVSPVVTLQFTEVTNLLLNDFSCGYFFNISLFKWFTVMPVGTIIVISLSPTNSLKFANNLTLILSLPGISDLNLSLSTNCMHKV